MKPSFMAKFDGQRCYKFVANNDLHVFSSKLNDWQVVRNADLLVNLFVELVVKGVGLKLFSGGSFFT